MSNSEEDYLFLVNKLLQGELSEEEKVMLFDLANDDEKIFLIKYLLDKPDKQQELESEIVYEKTKPNDMMSSSSLDMLELPKISKKINILKLSAIAASIAILFFSGLYFFKISNTSNQEWKIVSTKKGERKFLTFNDGTEVWLNNESELKVLKGFGLIHRKMELKGEGYFSVAKNKNLPLTVKTKDIEVNVLGTVFNLSAYPEGNSTTTSLIEGKVMLKLNHSNGDKNIVLQPGDQVKISKNGLDNNLMTTHSQDLGLTDAITYKKMEVKKDKVPDMLWVDNKLVFNDDSLSDIIQKLERWYGKTIIVQNKELLNLSFSGVFEERNCTDVLEYLKKTSDVAINYYIKNEIIYIN